MKPIRRFFIFFVIFPLFPFSATSADYTNLIFKGCTSQKLPDPSGVFSQNLENLFSSLVAQSSQRSFATTTTTGNDQNALVGLFQCRGDLTASQCYDCVSRVPKLVSKLCGADNAAARVQLAGCYLRYEVSGFRQTDPTEMLYRVCGKRHSGDPGFVGKRESAFGMAENGVKTSGGGGGGFYAGEYEEVYVLGQCEGSLGNSECGECVKSGFEKAKSECGDSISGQIYLHRCFISYSYYPHGVPNISSFSDGGKKGHQHTQRTVALAVGGVAVLGFVIVCLMFVRSVFRRKSKRDGY
ncbi:PREDICTED: cysteine-rich repeat secretory protein 56 isoform X1 [Tarenaya hassleriana]|uniref:cysteine-rich repeat secretory protein 56 isoform X2 n=1 Tax=Tarenaya hassleriana TaxID=28532 RepID=UPI00053C6029|nr:PREDICTED: cysteine-rich repeat secretory protein 56 isoform X2 [Tarenaya hassleriana]XP_010522532.1 PREDICTED: cysteine-rich repeat secretory protein 56 isoform X1 [Tarenaya hassleriana]